MDSLATFLHTLSYVLVPLLSAVVLHEYAHGWVANFFGDPTAKSQGRLTVNPLPHLDPFGSVIVPLILLLTPGGFLFGWAKPVPINPSQLHNPRRDMAFVAVAGPLMNLFLLIVSALLLSLFIYLDPSIKDTFTSSAGVAPAQDMKGLILAPLSAMAFFSLVINSLLFAFNLLPIPPLDGSRVLTSLLPYKQAYALSRLEPYGMFIILGLFVLDPHFPVISTVVGTVLETTIGTLMTHIIL